MSLASRITLQETLAPEPEDILSASLGVIFPGDTVCSHGDAEHSTLLYTSPHLARALLLELADPRGEEERRLFSHYLWNSSLLLAEFVERDTLGLAEKGKGKEEEEEKVSFDVRGLDVAELGAGAGLPSIMAGLLGANKVLVTDYPSEAVLDTLRRNVERNTKPEMAPPLPAEPAAQEDDRRGEEGRRGKGEVQVEGHSWGDFSPSLTPHHHVYDRVLACDCLWMPWQHDNLAHSISYLLAGTPSARAWVVAGFHTGRARMAGFFDAGFLRREGVGLEVERIWERDCDGVERAWDAEREEDDPTVRKRWLVVAVLRRVREEDER
ncbi:putative nicotinamide N-methyltransferase-like protein [Hapsidospora chrysogenum ATCC 11550]|uniref:Putative nicotinamide N-methyltransferase-like protein n=1 Tax=Hapsidospora chrysogenum (strain ATCC 11550 / CBS 779.69 / DSM 880 / IAM 14645 / JCM 23072 / IMI 49137) TaxID=857340 RepID=A0A086SU22_HAPC1|nr:putative nicotinamide N-methyltransferase-like protein [Hapsidospora chrysogenum ATCC 11550]